MPTCSALYMSLSHMIYEDMVACNMFILDRATLLVRSKNHFYIKYLIFRIMPRCHPHPQPLSRNHLLERHHVATRQHLAWRSLSLHKDRLIYNAITPLTCPFCSWCALSLLRADSPLPRSFFLMAFSHALLHWLEEDTSDSSLRLSYLIATLGILD